MFEFYNNECNWKVSHQLQVIDGTPSGVTVLHARSAAEDVVIDSAGIPYNGEVAIVNGQVEEPRNTPLRKILVHSAPLTAIAFNKGLFGDFGQYIVAIGLVSFWLLNGNFLELLRVKCDLFVRC